MAWKDTGVAFGKTWRCCHPLKAHYGGCPLAPSWGNTPSMALIPGYCWTGEKYELEDLCEHLVEVPE